MSKRLCLLPSKDDKDKGMKKKKVPHIIIKIFANSVPKRSAHVLYFAYLVNETNEMTRGPGRETGDVWVLTHVRQMHNSPVGP